MPVCWIVLALACASKPPGVVTPAAAADVIGVVDQVAEALPAWQGFATYEPRPSIVVMPTENHTKFDVDTTLATTKLVNELIQVSGSQFDVVDPEAWTARQAAVAEAEAAATKKKKEEPEAAATSFLLLHSELRTTTTDAGDGRPATHVLVSYRLVEQDTDRAVWASDFEWTRVKGKDGYEPVP